MITNSQGPRIFFAISEVIFSSHVQYYDSRYVCCNVALWFISSTLHLKKKKNKRNIQPNVRVGSEI